MNWVFMLVYTVELPATDLDTPVRARRKIQVHLREMSAYGRTQTWGLYVAGTKCLLIGGAL